METRRRQIETTVCSKSIMLDETQSLGDISSEQNSIPQVLIPSSSHDFEWSDPLRLTGERRIQTSSTSLGEFEQKDTTSYLTAADLIRAITEPISSSFPVRAGVRCESQEHERHCPCAEHASGHLNTIPDSERRVEYGMLIEIEAIICVAEIVAVSPWCCTPTTWKP
jgi:hypothetical protein